MPVAAQVTEGGAAEAVTAEERLWRALRLPEMMQVMQEEALGQADEMAEMLFQRGSDAGWRARVAAINAPERTVGLLRVALAQTLAAEPESVRLDAAEFLESPLGRRIVGLELQARRAIIDQDTEDGAIAAYHEATAADDPRLAQITRMIEGADLLEPAIAAAMNEALAFSEGFAAEGGFQMPMTDAEMLAQTSAQEPEIRAMIEEWLPAYLLLAYSPLGDEELAHYVAFSTSKSGAAMWAALNAAYEQVYARISHDMGEAAALHISGRQL